MKVALIILIVIVVVMAVVVLWTVMLELYVRRRTTARLRQLFGPEYKRVLDRYGEPCKAEVESAMREERLQELEMRRTERGTISTFNDTNFFDSNQSAL